MTKPVQPIFSFDAGGFTMVELLIATAILLLALSAAFGMMLSQKKAYKDENELIEMSQGTRASVDILLRDLRHAGYKVLESDYLGSLSDWVSSEYLPTYPATVSLASNSCPIITQGEGTNPDMITLFIADLKENALVADAASGSTTITLDPNAPGFSGSTKFRINDVIRLGDHTEFARITGVSGNCLTIDTNPTANGNQGLAEAHPAGEPIREVNVVTYAVINEGNDPSHEHHTAGHPVLKRKLNDTDYADVAEDVEDMQIIPYAPPRYKLQLISRTASRGDFAKVSADGYRRTELLADFRLRNYVKSSCLPAETPVITSLTGLNSSTPCNIQVAWTAATRNIKGQTLTSECAVTDYVVTYAPTPGTRFYTAYPGNTTSCSLNISEILRDANYTTNTYYISVAAVNAGGLGAYSAEQTISDTSPPSTPANLTASVSTTDINDAAIPGHSITLNWVGNPECDVVAYRIYRGTTSGGPYTLIASDPNINVGTTQNYTYQDINLACNTYYYVVKAYDLRYESPGSSEAFATVIDSNAPVGPTGFSAAPAGTTVTFNWTTSIDDPANGWGDDDVVGYHIYALFNGAEILLDSANPAGHTTKTLDNPLGYTNFGIKAIDICGNTSIMITQASCPNPPSVTIISPSSGDTVAGAVTIYGWASSTQSLEWVKLKINGGPWILAEGTATWSYTWNTLTLANGSYTITVKALDANDCSTDASINVVVSNGP
ncbi:MAG: Ig-like domain-containing protein [bacterium]